MSRVSINEMTTYRWSFDEDLVHYRDAGIAGMGVWRRKLSDFGDERGAEMLRESGLAVSSVSCAGGFTGCYGQTFRESLDDAHAALALAGELQAGCLVVTTGSRAGHTLRHAQRIVGDALRELGDAAARLGVQIAVQPMHRHRGERWTFLTTLDATLELLELCDHPRVGMVFDVFHLWGEASLRERIGDVARWIKLAALCDMHYPARNDDDRCPPGEGIVPLGDIVRTLEDSGYRGWYEVQVLGEPSWNSDYFRLLTDCRLGLQAACPELFGGHDQDSSPAIVLPVDSAAEPALRVATRPSPPQ